MPSITIRDVPEETHRELAARAARAGKSLQEYLREALEEMAGSLDVNTVLARARERVERSGTHLPAEKILQYRDEGRR